MPSKAAIKLEGVDGDVKGGLFHFLSLTPPPSVQSVCLKAYYMRRSTLVSAVLWKSVRVFIGNKFLIQKKLYKLKSRDEIIHQFAKLYPRRM